MSLKPVSGNSLDKSCGETIGSDCVTVSIGIPGTCKGASLTQVLAQLSTGGTTSCYTGNWIDFSSSIPLTGSGIGYTFTITNFGFNRGIGGGTPANNPQYKWTKDGDLKVRGTFTIFVNVTIPKLYVLIPFLSLPISCFPPAWTGTQYVTVCADVFPMEGGAIGVAEIAAIGIEYPTGVLTFEYSYSDGLLTPMRLDVDLGGTQFNLA